MNGGSDFSAEQVLAALPQARVEPGARERIRAAHAATGRRIAVLDDDPTGSQAVHDVSVAFPSATFTAIMGPSGSGKSTLLHCAAGLDRPTAGSVRLGGVELTTLSERKLTALRRSRVGFVF